MKFKNLDDFKDFLKNVMDIDDILFNLSPSEARLTKKGVWIELNPRSKYNSIIDCNIVIYGEHSDFDMTAEIDISEYMRKWAMSAIDFCNCSSRIDKLRILEDNFDKFYYVKP